MTINFNHPNSFGKEGVDHINISNSSKTQLGRVLDPSYYKTFAYPHLGSFKSVLNLWCWLKTDPLDDSIRKLTGYHLKNRLKETNSAVTHFKAIVAVATYEKLKSYPALIRDLKRLPDSVQFISYYYPSGSAVRLCSGYAAIVTEIANVLRDELKKGVEPDFTLLTTRGHNCGLTYLEPFVREHFGQERVDLLLETYRVTS